MDVASESTSKQASKQAILILAHKTDLVFRTLLQMLDHPKNDIFIHMDAKNKSYNPADTLKLVKYSRIFHTPRIKVQWGSYSLINATLILLEASTSQGHYEHYHLLSGADLPIQKQDDIIDFFERHHGLEFVNFQSDEVAARTGCEYRTRYYRLFQELIGQKGRLIWRVLNRLSITFQKICRVYRNKDVKLYKGSAWFSITDELSRYVLLNREWIKKVFNYGRVCDEEFLQTLLFISSFRHNLYCKDANDDMTTGSMRLIDWERGGPYVFRIADLEMIKNSEAMFARKFDENVDAQIIHEIKRLYS